MARDAKMKIVVGAENQARGPLRSVSDDIAGLSRQAQTTNDKLASLGAGLSSWATGIAAAFVANEVRRFAADSIQAFSNLNESVNKSQVVFKETSGVITDFTKNAARDLGMSQRVATEAAATFGNIFVAMGMGRPAAANMSADLVQLAADLASFNNTTSEVALEKLRAGMIGEAEPLRVFGILLDADAVKVKALEMGFASFSGEVSNAAKLQARYALILEQSKDAQGDHARTSGELAGSLRIQKAAVEDLQVAFGSLTAKPYTVVIQTVTKGLLDLTEILKPPDLKWNAYSDAMIQWQAANARVQEAYANYAAAQRLVDTVTNAWARQEAERWRDTAGATLDAERANLAYRETVVDVTEATLNGIGASAGLAKAYGGIGAAAAAATGPLTGLNAALALSTRNLAQRMPYTLPLLRPPSEYESLFMGGGGPQVNLENYALNLGKLSGDTAEEWQRAQEAANSAAANQWQQAYSKQIAVVEGILNQGMTTSIKLQDMRLGGAGGLGSDPNGPFKEIFRLQAWINDETWAETAEKFGVKDKAAGAEIIKKFQMGLWDESVTKMIDEKAIERAVLTEKQAEAYKKAFAEKIAKATGVGTDVAAATIWGGDYTNASAQTKKMTDTGQNMAGGLIAGIIKAQPDLEKEGYNAALAYKKGWNDGMSSKPPTSPTGPSEPSGYKKTGREYGSD